MDQSNQTQVLRLLANLKGGSLMLDMLEHPAANKGLSREIVQQCLRDLKSEGLVGSISERLDGPLYTLSKRGRELMSKEGFAFDEELVRRTQEIFRACFCKEDV